MHDPNAHISRCQEIELHIIGGERGATVEIRTKVNGRVWGPVQLLILEIHHRALKRVIRSDKWRVVHVEALGNGFHVSIADADHGIEAGIWLRHIDGELSCMIPVNEIYERDPEMCRLFAMQVLPELITIRQGMILLPINTGLLCPTDACPAVDDRFLIYGEQERWELTPSLPYCAGWFPDGGFMALVREGAADAECRVRTDGKGSGTVGFCMTLRRHWPDPVDFSNREIRFAPMPLEHDPIAFCARRLRKHIIEDLGKKTLVERAAESPEVAFMMDAYIMKLLHGVENHGHMMEGQAPLNPGSFQKYMTFAEAGDGLVKLRKAGVERILTQCTGWNARGHDGMYPMRFPIEERLGGESGFRRMIQLGQELGYSMQVHDNFMMLNLNAPGFDRDHAIIDLHGEPLIHGRWAGGLEASAWPLALPPERIEGHMRTMQRLGLNGMFYVDYMQQPLEVNYHPKHGGPRAACAAGQVFIVQKAKEIFGSCGTEFGFLPCAVAADHISTCGCSFHLNMCDPSWPISSLIDEDHIVPVWQMAMSGLVALEARDGACWYNVMCCVLYGGVPRDEWAVRPGVMPVLTDDRIAAQKATFDITIKQFGHLKRHEIIKFKKHTKSVMETEFSDGTVVLADFVENTLTVNGKTIARPSEIPVADIR